MNMNRRTFINRTFWASAGFAFTLSGCKGVAFDQLGADEFNRLSYDLLKEWCDAMIEHQVNDPSDPKVHGMLRCPSCEPLGVVHGRCWDAMYPFMHMAKATGEQKYLNAAINAFEWSKNLDGEDGRWTNDLSPTSWAGTTVFAAIALAESIHYHGDLVPPSLLKQWKERLGFAMEGYIYPTFTNFTYRNMNYGMTSLYAFNLIGRVLGEQKYIDRSRELAKDVRNYFTKPNKIIFGEGKPTHRKSPKGLLQVDLGYNVEESFNNLVLYAYLEKDEALLQFITESMNSHLEFMLPDGAWDNSWGTRQAKWSYWGSRTSDGCQTGFSMMADRNPAFGTAAFKNLELLKQCTSDGLLHGGPHYVSHGVKPCIHHTFAHAKVLAYLQDHKHEIPKVDKTAPLPRAVADGVKKFDELDVTLAARGPWRATVSAYDSQYTRARKRHIQQATGGSLAVLYHNEVGTVFAASMAKYMQVEPHNTQPQPGEDFTLTPRIETVKDGVAFNNLYDLQADVIAADDGNRIRFDIRMGLYDLDYNKIKDEVGDYKVSYLIDGNAVTIAAETADGSVSHRATNLVLPVISSTGEEVKVLSDKRIEIKKPGGTVVVESTTPMKVKESAKERIFNMVPGMECLPIIMELPKTEAMKASCSITVVV